VMVRRARQKNVLYDGLRLCWLTLSSLHILLGDVCLIIYSSLYKKFPFLQRIRRLFARKTGSIPASV